MVETYRHSHTMSRGGYRLLLIILWLVLLVLATKVWAGWATRSLSLLADSLHVLVSSFGVLLNVVAADLQRRGIGQVIRGHRKRETAMALLLVALIGFAGFSLLGIAVYQFQALVRQPTLIPAVQVDTSLLWFLGIVLAVQVCLVAFGRYEARVLELVTLRHNANYMLQTVWLGMATLVGLAGVTRGYVWLDSMIAIILLILLVPGIWRILQWQLPSLVEQMAIDPDLLARLALQVEGVSECLKARSQGVVGRQVFVQFYLRLHPEFAALSPQISDRLERILQERYGAVHIQIYVKNRRPVRPSTPSPPPDAGRS